MPDDIAADPLARNPSFHPGATIAGKYVVERLVGEGGLGVVVAAKHLQLDQPVAIKYLRPRALGTRGIADRFLREARLAARMRSEHVVHVYDVGTLPDGAPYMVMELLSGSDLGKQLTTMGPLTIERAVDYVLQACEALAEAHAAGIVHRDIKPDNLFVATTTGGKSVLKILDFGISKLSAKRSSVVDQRELTEAGDKFGTPVYMSPEQLMAATDVDARADVWAMGVVFFELLTGRLPFDGDSLPELCTAILNKPPIPLLQARPSLPARLQAVLDGCLEKDPARRFQNVAELAQELAEFAGAGGQDRIDHVVRIVRGGGETVRPATPLPDASSARALREVSTLAEAAERAATTGSGVASWGSSSAPSVGTETARPRRQRAAFLAAAGLLAAAVVSAALGEGNRGTARDVSPASAAVANAPSAPAEAPVAVPLPVAEPPAVEPAATASAEPATSASVAPVVAAPSPLRRGPRVVGPPGKRPPHPAHNDPNAVINPFE